MHVEYINQFVKMNYTRKNITKTKKTVEEVRINR